MVSMKNSPALYEERTSGPDATYRNPPEFPERLPNTAKGVTYRFPSWWKPVSTRTADLVRRCQTPAALQNLVEASISSSVSPSPSMMEVFVTSLAF